MLEPSRKRETEPWDWNFWIDRVNGNAVVRMRKCECAADFEAPEDSQRVYLSRSSLFRLPICAMTHVLLVAQSQHECVEYLCSGNDVIGNFGYRVAEAKARYTRHNNVKRRYVFVAPRRCRDRIRKRIDHL